MIEMAKIDLLVGLEKPVKETIDLYGGWLKADKANIAALNERLKEVEHRVKFEELFNPKGKHWETFKNQFAVYFAKGLAYGLAIILFLIMCRLLVASVGGC